MGTAIKYSHAVTELEKKGAAYGIEAVAVDGMDLMAVIAAANIAAAKVRSSGKPYLLVCNTYRFRAHSMFDAELYRDKKEVEEWKKRDPIPQFEQFLLQKEWITDAEIAAFENKIEWAPLHRKNCEWFFERTRFGRLKKHLQKQGV